LDHEPPAEPAEPQPSPLTAVLQFFVVPLVVVALAAGVFLMFGYLTREDKSFAETLAEVRAGSLTRRWQAAYELSRRVVADPEAARASGVGPLVIDTFESARGEDARVRRYLASVLGALGDPAALPALVAALEDADPETRAHAAWALAALGDRRAVAALIERLRGEQDKEVRSVTAYALGRLGDPAALPALRVASEASDPALAWQATFARAQLGDATARPALLRLLDPGYVSAAPGITPEQQLEVRLNALRALVLVAEPEDRKLLSRLAAEDPELKLQAAAHEALAQLEARLAGTR